MSVPPVIMDQVCPHCGAMSRTQTGKCWLCHASSTTPNPFSVTMVAEEPSPDAGKLTLWDGLFIGLLGLCVILTVLIGIGFAVQDRGMLIPYAILIGPAYLVTVVRGMLSFGSKKKASPAGLFLTFVVSALVTVSIATVLVVGAFVVLFIMCLTSLGQLHP